MKYELSGTEKKIYDYCDEMRTLISIKQHLQNQVEGLGVSDNAIKDLLRFFVTNRLMITDGDHYLSLAICQYDPKTDVQKSFPAEIKIGEANLVNLVS